MQQHEFNLFAERCKESGLSTKQALDKFVKAMMQGPKLKIVKKQTIRSYENGIKTFPDGRERCMTKEAWQTRREEVWERDGYKCQRCFRTSLGNLISYCHKAVALAEAHTHHIRKRSVGRDDRHSNLVTYCESCHRQIHDEFKKRGAGQ